MTLRSIFATLLAVLTFALLADLAVAQPSPRDVARQIDRTLAAEVFAGEDATGQPVGLIDDEAFLRRASLDIVGELPTTDDILVFSLDSDPDKREKLVNLLLADKAYGENWARYWRDVILYRATDQRSAITANPLTTYLIERLNQNTSWDEIATEFVTAEGDVRENGATALIMAQGGEPEETVAEVSRIFMGIQIQCAQCHDHPTDRWTRDQFHELAAFFPRVARRPQGQGMQRTFVVYANDRARFRRRGNANNRFAGTLEHRMPDLDDPSAQGELMQPVFFATDQKLRLGASDQQRRSSLARWMTSESNPWFAKALVNRIWSELVGEGFCEPVDDIGPDRQATAPETLTYLADQFVASGYDVKWLYRSIMATEAYQRDARSRRRYNQTPFLANCNQRLRGDQLYTSLISVIDLPNFGRRQAPRGAYGQARGPRQLFSVAFGYDPSELREDVSGSIPQALVMMNSPIINQGITARPGSSLARMLNEVTNNEDLVVELYLKALARDPSDAEVKTCLAYVNDVGNRREAFEDILWALINSTEFLYRR